MSMATTLCTSHSNQIERLRNDSNVHSSWSTKGFTGYEDKRDLSSASLYCPWYDQARNAIKETYSDGEFRETWTPSSAGFTRPRRRGSARHRHRHPPQTINMFRASSNGFAWITCGSQWEDSVLEQLAIACVLNEHCTGSSSGRTKWKGKEMCMSNLIVFSKIFLVSSSLSFFFASLMLIILFFHLTIAINWIIYALTSYLLLF